MQYSMCIYCCCASHVHACCGCCCLALQLNASAYLVSWFGAVQQGGADVRYNDFELVLHSNGDFVINLPYMSYLFDTANTDANIEVRAASCE
jgi:hypothetical protein